MTFLGAHSNQVVCDRVQPGRQPDRDGVARRHGPHLGRRRQFRARGGRCSATRARCWTSRSPRTAAASSRRATTAPLASGGPAVDPIMSLVGRHTGAGRAVAFSPDGALIASVGLDAGAAGLAPRRHRGPHDPAAGAARRRGVLEGRDAARHCRTGRRRQGRARGRWRRGAVVHARRAAEVGRLRRLGRARGHGRRGRHRADLEAQRWVAARAPARRRRASRRRSSAPTGASSQPRVRTTKGASGALRRASCSESSIGHHEDDLTSIAYSRDGKLLATSSIDADGHIWNARRSSYVRALRGHTVARQRHRLQPGRTLARDRGADDRRHVGAGDEPAGSRRGRRCSSSAATSSASGASPFAPDSRRVASISARRHRPHLPLRAVRHVGELVRLRGRGWSRLGSNLTTDEQQTYLGG